MEPERGQIRSLTERLQPWAKYRGRADLIPITNQPELPEATVTRDRAGRLIVFAQLTAIQEIRLKWEGREIDTIPSDDEIAAWLAWIVIDCGGDRGTPDEIAAWLAGGDCGGNRGTLRES